MSKSESNIVKGIAVILLLFHHLFYDADIFKEYTIFFNGGMSEQKLLISLASFSKICVAIFVFISAYGISRQLMEKDVLNKASGIARSALIRYIKLIIGLFCIYVPFFLISFMVHRHTFTAVYGEGFTAVKYVIIDLFGLAKFFGTPTFNSTWWYISLAILIIITVPILNLIYNKVSSIIIPLTGLIVPLVSTENSLANYYLRYITGLTMAVVFARSNVIEKYKKWYQGRLKGLKLSAVVCVSLILIVLCYFFRVRIFIPYYYIDNALAVLVVLFISALSQIKFLKWPMKILEFIGVYSMNIFLCHTFIKSYYFEKFTYSFKYWWLMLLILLLITLAISFVIEQLKIWCGVNKLIGKINKKFNMDLSLKS